MQLFQISQKEVRKNIPDTKRNSCGLSQWIKLRLPFYNQTTGRRVWKAIWMSWRKQWEIYDFLSRNRKLRKWEDHKIQNNIHRHCKIFGRFFVNSFQRVSTKVNSKIVSRAFKMIAEDDFLTFRCVDCNKAYEEKFYQDLSRNSKARMIPMIKTLTNFVSCYEKVFIHKSTLMTG